MDGIIAAGYALGEIMKTVFRWAGPELPVAPHLLRRRPFVRQHGRSFAWISVGEAAAFWLEFGRGLEVYVPPAGHARVLKALRRGRLFYGRRQEKPLGSLIAQVFIGGRESLGEARDELIRAWRREERSDHLLPLLVIAELSANLVRHSRGGRLLLLREAGVYTVISENTSGALPFANLAVPLLTPQPTRHGKGIWLLLAEGAHVHVEPGPPVRVAVSFRVPASEAELGKEA